MLFDKIIGDNVCVTFLAMIERSRKKGWDEEPTFFAFVGRFSHGMHQVYIP